MKHENTILTVEHFCTSKSTSLSFKFYRDFLLLGNNRIIHTKNAHNFKLSILNTYNDVWFEKNTYSKNLVKLTLRFKCSFNILFVKTNIDNCFLSFIRDS